MSIINILLFYLLITIYSQIIVNDIIRNDAIKCTGAFKEGLFPSQVCTDINPTLEGLEYGSQCCKISIRNDPIAKLENEYGKNWKQVLMSLLNIKDEKSLDEMIKSKYPIEEYNYCFLLPEKRNSFLYSTSFLFGDFIIGYDCGDGEQIFNNKNYIPIEEDEKEYKDIFDCDHEHGETNCYERASKLYSQNSQCCWCHRIYNDSNLRAMSSCHGFTINKMEDELKNYMTEIYREKYTLKCSCLNKEGNSVKATLNSVTGQITIE